MSDYQDNNYGSSNFGNNNYGGSNNYQQPKKNKGPIVAIISLIIVSIVVLVVAVIAFFTFTIIDTKGTGSTKEKGTYASTQEGEADDQLSTYIEEFENEELKAYLEGGNLKGLNYYDEAYYSPLYYAIQCENYDAMSILLDFGADINQDDSISDYASPLMFATSYDDVKAVQLLIERGASLEERDRYGATALLYAAGRDTTVLEVLIANGADVNIAEYDDWNALHQAASFGNAENYNILVNAGLPEDTRTLDGYSVAHSALYSDNVGFLEELLGKGIELNQPTTNGDTLIHIAKSDAMAEYIMNNYDCDFTVKNINGSTALHSAVRSSLSADMIKRYLDNGADPNIQNKNGSTPLMLSVNNSKFVELLLEYGADKTLKDSDGETAFDYISYYDDDEVDFKTKTLLKIK